MKTIRYNKQTKKYTVHHERYKTSDNKNGRIDPPWVQLEIIEVAQPESYNAETQLISMDYDILINEGEHNLYGINGTATQVWSVTSKTEQEIADEKAAAQAALEASSDYKIRQLEGVIEELITKLNDKEIIP